MVLGKKVAVVMPAYNAQGTLEKTVRALDRSVVDVIILVDDASSDSTADIAERLGLYVYRHQRNIGYGGNQKSCYRLALSQGADIVVMVHPDLQYDPRLVPSICFMIANDVYDVVLGSRILGSKLASKGMPLWRWVANRILTFFQNVLLGEKLSEYHTGLRAFGKDVLKKLPLEANSDGFVFDNEMLCQILYFNFRVGEISCPSSYFEGASSIPFAKAVIYGCGVIRVTFQFLLNKTGIIRSALFDKDKFRLSV